MGKKKNAASPQGPAAADVGVAPEETKKPKLPADAAEASGDESEEVQEERPRRRRRAPAPPPNLSPQGELKYTLLRCFLTVIIFLVLHTGFQEFIFVPYVQGGSGGMSNSDLANDIRSKACPAGMDCKFDLRDDLENFLGERNEE